MALIKRPVEKSSIADDVVATLADLCGDDQRATIDKAHLAEDVLSVLHAVGIARDETQASRLWHDLEDPEPDPRQLARAFGRMGKVPDPLDPQVCIGQARLELLRLIRPRWTRWGSPGGCFQPDWASLTIRQREEVRELARRLESWHRSHVRLGRPRKSDLDTLLHELAEVFACHSGFALHIYKLPHSETSRFIRFAAKALAGCYDPTEVSVRALSRRWKRTKDGAKKTHPPLKRRTIRKKAPKRVKLLKWGERSKTRPR